MRASTLKYRILWLVASLSMLIMFVMPFHAFLTIFAADIFGHYTAFRLWKEVLLLLCIIGTLYLVITDGKIRSHTLTRRLVWLVMAYIALNVIWGLVQLYRGELSAKALGYGLIIDLRFPIFFLITWAVALRTSRLRKNWQKIVLWPAAIVVAFGLLQLLLPHDFLRHFGYGPLTIDPYETINSNLSYQRITSTLRGANPLGAYLLIPISILTALLIAGKRSWQYVALYIGSLVTLFFSFSRSAWIGATLSIGAVCIQQLDRKYLKPALLVLAGLVILAGGVFALGWQDSSRFQNYFQHTEDNSKVETTSNGNRLASLESGWHDLVNEPLGAGPGSAGPASIYNNQPARIAENYYLQVAQETGWIGLGLFLLINIGVGYLLWVRRHDPLAVMLYASLIGISFINLLSHAWADDTLAYIWWGLAGIAMVPPKEAGKTYVKP